MIVIVDHSKFPCLVPRSKADGRTLVPQMMPCATRVVGKLPRDLACVPTPHPGFSKLSDPETPKATYESQGSFSALARDLSKSFRKPASRTLGKRDLHVTPAGCDWLRWAWGRADGDVGGEEESGSRG